MRAAIFHAFQQLPQVCELPDPVPADDGVVVRVEANGICRSDWHGWMGHDPDVRLPHVPGHELAGIVEAAGARVQRWKPGDRVTVPFCCGCGQCAPCREGQTHVCRNYFQPGFTAWGAFAERVALRYADINLVRLPDQVDSVAAASLGCRFATAYRAVIQQGRIVPGEWIVVFGCGGVGLSAVMVAVAVGARTIAVDLDPDKLSLASELGAAVTILGGDPPERDVGRSIREMTDGGAHVTVDALGSERTAVQAIESLREQGRHVQVGLLLGDSFRPRLPLEQVIAKELQIVGSHGLPAAAYAELIELVVQGRLDPGKLVRRRISLDEAPEALAEVGQFRGLGVTVIDRFR